MLAQQVTAKNGRVFSDTVEIQVDVRSFDGEAIEREIEGNPDYNYEEDPQKAKGPLEKLWLAFKEKLRQLFEEQTTNFIIDMLTYLVMAGALVGIIYHLSRSEYSGYFRRYDLTTEGDVSKVLSVEQIENLDEVLQNMELQENHRGAIRILFLKVILKLRKSKSLEWHPEMTNHQLLNQIKDKKIRDKLLPIISIYEYVWYGEYDVSDTQYSDFKQQFCRIISHEKEEVS